MVPQHSKGIVVERREFRLWADKFLKVHVKATAVAVFLGIHGLGFDAPSSFGIHISRNTEVNVVVEGKVIAEIPQAQSSNLLPTVGWKDNTRCLFLRSIGNQSKGQSEWGGDAIEVEVERSRYDLFSRNGFDFGGRDVPVGLG
jgi:hypothetical protein